MLYALEDVVYEWDSEKKKVTGAVLGGVLFRRRQDKIGHNSDNSHTFTVTPTQPIEQLLAVSRKLSPPDAPTISPVRAADFVDIRSFDPTIRYALRSATPPPFVPSPVYNVDGPAFLPRPAAEALAKAHKRLAKLGYGIIVYDTYRPWFVTHTFYCAIPEHQKYFAADPSKGSLHNRGCAADISIFSLETGKVVDMGAGYDELTERSYSEYQGGTSLQRYLRRVLRKAMEAEGFSVFIWEWWHFDYKDAPHYPLFNVPLEDIH